MSARKWCVMATAHTALHSRFANCCSSGLAPQITADQLLAARYTRTGEPLAPACMHGNVWTALDGCAKAQSLRVFKKAREHVAGIAEEQLHIDVLCGAADLLQVAWLAQVDAHLHVETRLDACRGEWLKEIVCWASPCSTTTQWLALRKLRSGNWAVSSEHVASNRPSSRATSTTLTPCSASLVASDLPIPAHQMSIDLFAVQASHRHIVTNCYKSNLHRC